MSFNTVTFQFVNIFSTTVIENHFKNIEKHEYGIPIFPFAFCPNMAQQDTILYFKLLIFCLSQIFCINFDFLKCYIKYDLIIEFFVVPFNSAPKSYASLTLLYPGFAQLQSFLHLSTFFPTL